MLINVQIFRAVFAFAKWVFVTVTIVTIVTSAETLRKSAISPYFSGNSIYAGKPRC